MIIKNNYTATAASGMAAFSQEITVSAAPPGGNVFGVVMPVTISDAGGTTVHTYVTSVDGTLLTVAYVAPGGGWAGPLTVRAAPNAQVHASLQSVETHLNPDSYVTTHEPRYGQVNDLTASSYGGTSHGVTLPAKVSPGFVTDDIITAPETIILFRCDDVGITFTFTPPGGHTVRWADGTPAPASGKLKVLVALRYIGTDIFGRFEVFA